VKIAKERGDDVKPISAVFSVPLPVCIMPMQGLQAMFHALPKSLRIL